MGMILLKTS